MVHLYSSSTDVRLSSPWSCHRCFDKLYFLITSYPCVVTDHSDITLISVISSKRPFLDGTTPDPTGQWTGRSPSIFYSASIIWGAVAPARFFSGKYTWLYMGFVLGAIVPLVGYWAHKKWPGRKINKFVFPIVCSGATMVPQ